jgi:hypothetical protein
MENLSPEARALYDLLKADVQEEYESHFLQYQKDVVKVFIDDTKAQFKVVNTTVEGLRTTMRAYLTSAKAALGPDIADLAATMEQALRSSPGAVAVGSSSASMLGAEGRTVGPDGHRGTACAPHTASPVGGTFSDRSPVHHNPGDSAQQMNSDSDSHGPCVDLPHFDGANPKIWQRRSEEYFNRWRTPGHFWVTYASSLFIGDAVTWLEAYLHQTLWPPWPEFVLAVLVRCLFHICQVTTVEDYLQRFSQLMDRISAYETHPDPIHYIRRFLDGLKPAMCVSSLRFSSLRTWILHILWHCCMRN